MIPSLNTSILYLAAFTVLWKETSCCIYLTHTVSHWKNITDVLVYHAGIFKFAQSQTGLGWTLNIIYFQIYQFFPMFLELCWIQKMSRKGIKITTVSPSIFFSILLFYRKKELESSPYLNTICFCVYVLWFFTIMLFPCSITNSIFYCDFFS